MSVEELREEACDCLFEIVNKGMDPVDKTKLVESLCQVLQSAGFFNVEQVWDCTDAENRQKQYSENVSLSPTVFIKVSTLADRYFY